MLHIKKSIREGVCQTFNGIHNVIKAWHGRGAIGFLQVVAGD